MGIISRYSLDESTEKLGTDNYANRHLSNTNVVSVTDTYGKCAYFDGTAKMTLAAGSVPTSMKYNNFRSYSCWFKGYGGIHSNGGSNSTVHRYAPRVTSSGIMLIDLKGPTVTGTTMIDLTKWHHYASVYDGVTVSLYLDGVLEKSRNISYLGTFSGAFGLGWDQTRSALYFTGFLSDYKSWSHVISADNIAKLYSKGPLNGFLASISATLYTHIGALSWTTTQGASTNTVSQLEDGGPEEIIISDTTELSFRSTEIKPGSSYVFNLYTDLDLVTPAATVSKTAPIISNSSVSDMASHIGNDFTILSEESYGSVKHLIRSIFSTGDNVTLSNGKNVFIEDSDNIVISPGNSYLTPFETTLSSGQEVTLTNSDGSGTNVVEYDENTDQILVGSKSYDANTSFVVGSYRIVVKKV
jgi:hypothetical protein